MASAGGGQALAELLGGLVGAVAAVAKLDVPEPADIYYYRNLPEYRELSDSCSSQAQQLLHAARTNLARPAAAAAADGADSDSGDEALYDDMAAVLDDSLERLDTALDAAQQQTEAYKLGGWAAPAGAGGALRAAARGLHGPGSTAAAGLSQGRRVQRHVASLARPQDSFPDAVDNGPTPWTPARFAHLAPRLAAAAAARDGTAGAGAAAAAGDRLAAHAAQLAAAGGQPPQQLQLQQQQPHPYAQELSSLVYQPWQLEGPSAAVAAAAALEAPGLDATPFSLVDTRRGLDAMVAALRGERQIALDLEHHSYRSFQGFTCLLQLSSRSADWVVDTLALRGQLGPALAGLLADPAVEKVLHGADSDVLWLQRDFGLFIVNLFDTGQAARVLAYPSASLAHLMERHTGFCPDKRYQLADWRLRPLPPDMLHYARCDTHYLLPVADVLKAELRAAGAKVPPSLAAPPPPGCGATGALGVVFERSRRISASAYRKPVFSEAAYLEAAGRWGAALPPRNMAAFAALFAWRDATARALDESEAYIMPKALLLELARALPGSTSELRRLLGSTGGGGGASGLTGGHALLAARAEELCDLIARAQQQAGPPAAAAAAAAGGAAAAAVTQAPAQPAAGAQGAANEAAAVLPAIQPKQLPALVPRKKPAGGSGLRPAGSSTAAAAPPGSASSDAAAAADVPTRQPGQQQLDGDQQQEQQQQQPAELPPQEPAAAPAPKQLAAPQAIRRKGGSSMAGLLSSKHKQPQQQPVKPAALQQRFALAFLAPAAAAASAAATPAAEQQEAATAGAGGSSEAEAAAEQPQPVSAAAVRSVVDQLMAENDEAAAEQEQQQHVDNAANGQQAAAASDGSAGGDDDDNDDGEQQQHQQQNGFTDLDYVPLSVQHKNKPPRNRKRKAAQPGGFTTDLQQQQQQQQAPGEGGPAAEGQQQQQQQPGAKRKRGIFDSAVSDEADDTDGSSDDEQQAGGPLLPSLHPGQPARRPQQQAWQRQQQQQEGAADGAGSNAAADADGADGEAGRGRGRGRGRQQRGGGRADGRGGGRAGRGRRGGFMAAATASLAAVRAGQAGRGLGANPFAIPDANLMKGGKRKAVAPRGGNRSASFKH